MFDTHFVVPGGKVAFQGFQGQALPAGGVTGDSHCESRRRHHLNRGSRRHGDTGPRNLETSIETRFYVHGKGPNRL